MKRIGLLLLCAVMCFMTMSSVCVYAESWPSTSNIQTYVKSTGNNTTVYQTSSSSGKYGTIYASDLITITGYSGSRLKVSYPTKKGAKSGYINKSDVTSAQINQATAAWTATSSMTVYRRSSGSATIGSVSKNDRCYTLASENGRTQIIYPILRGYKMGWVASSQIPSSNQGGNKTSSASSSTTSSWQFPMNNAYCTWRTKTDMSWSVSNGGSRPDHLGIDIYGTSGIVYAAASGKVVACSSSNSGANGRYVIIQHTLNEKTVYSFYAHLSSISVSTGNNVSKGTKIGIAGGSGNGSNSYYGTHLHFAIVDTLWPNGDYYGYSTSFSGNKNYYKRVTYYNPVYVINYNKLP